MIVTAIRCSWARSRLEVDARVAYLNVPAGATWVRFARASLRSQAVIFAYETSVNRPAVGAKPTRSAKRSYELATRRRCWPNNREANPAGAAISRAVSRSFCAISNRRFRMNRGSNELCPTITTSP